MSNVARVTETNAPPAVVGEATTILQVIQRAAADPQCDIEKMERLMQMHERFQARQAEQQYAEALATMQQELPPVPERGGIKDRSGRVQSTYALWEDINEALKPVLAKHGFALTFRIPRNAAGVEVEGVLSHSAGHSERTSILLPVDVSGSKNAVQAVASSVSYGKRYTAGALLNFTTHGEDDDAYSAGTSEQTTLQDQVVIDIIERVDEAENKEQLTEIWKAAVAVLRDAGDKAGYERVKTAVGAKGKELEVLQ
ncbi:ERF family protein [Pseudomonas typographi]|uniref:ERF family protein n=1 Tax=Pseudomonas typographi TaxID=2715964 RepID=UPI0016889E75|nr:ERF family protein [Pseudomonas typographi]MBD1590287.1 single-stranded DNA-binding protein [Pseudomonas typographi]